MLIHNIPMSTSSWSFFSVYATLYMLIKNPCNCANIWKYWTNRNKFLYPYAVWMFTYHAATLSKTGCPHTWCRHPVDRLHLLFIRDIFHTKLLIFVTLLFLYSQYTSYFDYKINGYLLLKIAQHFVYYTVLENEIWHPCIVTLVLLDILGFNTQGFNHSVRVTCF